MNDFYEVKTVDLVGAALDWAVANAVGLPLCEEAGGVGETAPIAICRAVVRHESGDVVRVPAELIGNANPL